MHLDKGVFTGDGPYKIALSPRWLAFDQSPVFRVGQ